MIGIATEKDFDVIVEMAREFAKVNYPQFTIDNDKLKRGVEGLLNNGVVFFAYDPYGNPTGMLGAQAYEPIFSNDLLVQERIWWMSPYHRNSRVSFDLIEAFLFWAEKVKGAKIIQMSSVENASSDLVHKFYTKKGFKLLEKNYIKVSDART